MIRWTFRSSVSKPRSRITVKNSLTLAAPYKFSPRKTWGYSGRSSSGNKGISMMSSASASASGGFGLLFFMMSSGSDTLPLILMYFWFSRALSKVPSGTDFARSCDLGPAYCEAIVCLWVTLLMILSMDRNRSKVEMSLLMGIVRAPKMRCLPFFLLERTATSLVLIRCFFGIAFLKRVQIL
eukprot:Lithocolla_globosa_v1_NODE_3684_length_1606_cov_14.600258.p2 type:complete len:182 gc:universal NODE_3684_length_1606_cov_14.600258:1413-868(-)